MCRLIAGIANGKDFVEPIEVKSIGHLGKTGVDEWSSAIMKFPGDIIAELSTGVAVDQDNVVKIFGTRGNIRVNSPWFCDGTIALDSADKTEEIIPEKCDLYGIEADTVAEYIDNLEAKSPAMSREDTLGNMKTLDMWRDGFNFLYDTEKAGAFLPTIDNRPLEKRKESKMKYGEIPGIGKKISRIVMGTMLEGQYIHRPAAHVLFDEFVRHGGNCFDTAVVYGGGESEIALGQWLKNRNIREQVVIAAKGAHTPFCNPVDLKAQFLESLDRMGIKYADIYMMHRDNLDIPASEFIDILNELKDKGLVRAFGGSNWSLERVEEANKYAKAKGKTGFTVVSNNFSLASLVEPMWGGCISSSDTKSRNWLEKNNMSLFSWSSQARGFFSGRANPNDKSDEELVRCWYSEDNFKRLERAKELAKKKGVAPITIAGAYVLNQKFPAYPIIGPRNLTEMAGTMDALSVELTDKEVRWLNLKD